MDERKALRKDILEIILNPENCIEHRLAVLFLRGEEPLEILVLMARANKLKPKVCSTLFETERGKTLLTGFEKLYPYDSISFTPGVHVKRPGTVGEGTMKTDSVKKKFFYDILRESIIN